MVNKYLQTLLVLLVAGIVLVMGLHACGNGSGQTGAENRPFLMGSTPFFVTAAAFPDWRFENLEDRDLLSWSTLAAQA